MSRREIWLPRLVQEAKLSELEGLLASDSEGAAPEAIERQVERAALLNALGRSDEARQAYLDLLTRAPTRFDVLNDFGALLAATGFQSAARTLYAEAVRHHPGNPMGHVNLANLLYRAGDLEAARAHFEAALRVEAAHPQAHQGLGNVLAALGDREGAERHRRAGYRDHAITMLPYRGEKRPLSVLLLVSAAGGDIPTGSLLDDRRFLTSVVVADFSGPGTPLPPHRVVFNAIGDADLCRPALEAATALLRRTTAPVINHPTAVLSTGRADNARRLGALSGVVTPRMVELPRRRFLGPDAVALLADRGLMFPLLLRTPGHHTGKHFVRVETAAGLAAAAASLPGEELLAIEYLDARGADGNTRKYRVMIIDSVLHPLHVAVSRDWKVHYFTADMAGNPNHRAEDAGFLTNMPGTLGPKAMTALAGIRDALGLDYAGIDFGLNPHGDVLLFEANATMLVRPPDKDERWNYRRSPVARILAAVGDMIVARAADDLHEAR
jgi:hypothetical protein